MDMTLCTVTFDLTRIETITLLLGASAIASAKCKLLIYTSLKWLGSVVVTITLLLCRMDEKIHCSFVRAAEKRNLKRDLKP